jgi:alpha-glucosidase (family GH31 glycosyl hydrolase)
MAYEFPGQGMEAIQDQFMLRSSILVAPFIEKGTKMRNVAFP